MSDLFAGAAVCDITPPVELAMAGFAARTGGATGAHDMLRATALVLNDTALLSLDLLAAEADLVRDITACCGVPGLVTVVLATHTHGGPECRGNTWNGEYRTTVIDQAVRALTAAATARVPARLRIGQGAAPGVARNRRHEGGITDQSLPVLAIDGEDGVPIATMVSYACHPTVLGANNRLWTADWHGPLRQRLEAARPGAVALTLTGCSGDANLGHSAHSSISLEAGTNRTFKAAEAAADRIADSALAARLCEVRGGVAVATAHVTIGFKRREKMDDAGLAVEWRRLAQEEPDPAMGEMYRIWAQWADREPGLRVKTKTLPLPVSALRWGALEIICLPGEIFAATALELREEIGNPHAVILGYAGDNPGYIAPRAEYAFGGYEVDEAHRYYGQPATFAPGAAERLAAQGGCLVKELRTESETNAR